MFRKIFIALLLFFQATGLNAQIDANDWLDGQYEQDWYTFDVVDEGIYRISYPDLDSAGINMSQLLAANLMLYRNGQEVPIYVSTPGLMVENDFIEFYAYGEDGELDQHLYTDTNWLAHKRTGLFHDTATYFLTWDNNTNHKRIIDSANILTNLPPAETHVTVKSGLTMNYSFVKGYERKVGDIKIVLSDFEQGEGFSGRTVLNTTAQYLINTRNIASDAGDAQLEIQIAGINDDDNVEIDHHFEFSIGTYAFDSVLSGFEHQVFQKNIPINQLQSPQTTLSVTNINDLSNTSRIACNYYELSYPCDLDVYIRDQFKFYLTNEIGHRYLEFTSVSNQNTDVYFYDLTNNIRLKSIPNTAGDERVKLTKNSSGKSRAIYLSSEYHLKKVNNFKKVVIKNFDDVQNQGDFVIVVDGELLSQDSTFLNDYISHRATKFEKPIVITMEELSNIYAFGKKLHPMAFVNLTDDMTREWFYDVKYLFLVGQAVPYSSKSSYKRYCKVPSFGHYPSDMMLTAKIGSKIPQIPVGRIAALQVEDVINYLNKVIDHESRLNNYPNTKAGKEWMKQIVHLGGGKNETEQIEFARNLSEYEYIIENNSFGGNVHTFLKKSSDPIQTALSETFDTLISNGVSLITFFGHSSATTLEFSIYNPENYENNGKYPLVISNGCLSGDIHRQGTSAAKDYVLLDQKGAIGFLASTYYSFATLDHIYSKSFYERLSQSQYGESIGNIMLGVIEEMLASSSKDEYVYTTQLLTLHGDPSIEFNTHEKPDYVIEEDDVALIPENISIDNDTFTVQVVVTNLGIALEDSFKINVTRKFPDDQTKLVHSNWYSAPKYKDTFNIVLDIESENALGYNQIIIDIDPLENTEFGKIDELEDVLNNSITKDLIILSDDIIPVYPFENSICNDQKVELKASTVNMFAAEQTYVFEIDTVPNFNSSFLQRKKITSAGGLVSWEIDQSFIEPDKVYFWRTANEDVSNADLKWFSSSFYYDPSQLDGWYQGHSGQYEHNQLANVATDGVNQLRFIEDIKDLSLLTYNLIEMPTGYFLGDDIGWSLNGVSSDGKALCYRGGNISPNSNVQSNSGIVFSVFDSATFLPWKIQQGDYGSLNCMRGAEFASISFADYAINDQSLMDQKLQNIANFMDAIPSGQYVLAYLIAGEMTHPGAWPEYLKLKFRQQGAHSIDTLGAGIAWAMFYKKDDLSYTPLEIVGQNSIDVVELDTTIEGAWNSGYMESQIVGPSYGWQTLEFRHYYNDGGLFDDYGVDVIGLNNQGEPSLLFENVKNDTSLESISSRDYPYLKLVWNVADDSTRTPRNLDYWKVNYRQVPELALAPNEFFNFYSDTLREGDSLKIAIRMMNLTDKNFDSIRTSVAVINHQNQLNQIDEFFIDSLYSNDSSTFKYSFNTLDLKNSNRLVLFVNPLMDQLEHESFNNIAVVPFYVQEDNANPILDVTFDGVHIIDGDYVSTQPYILIRLRDENQFVALNDTSLINIILETPSDTMRVNFASNDIVFIPGDNLIDNLAEIQYTPAFEEEGVYKLSVQGRDRAGNASGYFDYNISFTILKESSITRVFNYPNPFTTSTRFVFELTGTQIPDYFKIQIMTITGKVIKEITQAEINDIHIGRNITDYAWDGTDTYGDPVGNGVYLYRVVAKINGENIELNQVPGQEQYFNSGIGKMTIIR